MKYATVLLLYLTSINSQADQTSTETSAANAIKEKSNKVMVDSAKKAAPITTEITTCQPNCKPRKFSKRK